MLARQQYLDQVPRLFDRGELVDEIGSEGRIRVACKTGMIDGVRADVGVVWLDGRPVSYAVMSESAGDDGRDLDADPQLVNAEAGWILVRAPVAGGQLGASPRSRRTPRPRWSRLHAAAAPDGSERRRERSGAAADPRRPDRRRHRRPAVGWRRAARARDDRRASPRPASCPPRGGG